MPSVVETNFSAGQVFRLKEGGGQHNKLASTVSIELIPDIRCAEGLVVSAAESEAVDEPIADVHARIEAGIRTIRNGADAAEAAIVAVRIQQVRNRPTPVISSFSTGAYRSRKKPPTKSWLP